MANRQVHLATAVLEVGSSKPSTSGAKSPLRVVKSTVRNAGCEFCGIWFQGYSYKRVSSGRWNWRERQILGLSKRRRQLKNCFEVFILAVLGVTFC